MQSHQPLTNICGFSTRKHVIFCTFYQKYTFIYRKKIPSRVTESWILVIWLIHSPCSVMINTLAMTSNDKYNGPLTVGRN